MRQAVTFSNLTFDPLFRILLGKVVVCIIIFWQLLCWEIYNCLTP
jgi:hypothetical protein